MSYVLTKAFTINPDNFKDYEMPFKDISSSNTYAPYIKALYYSGIAQGYLGNYSPKSSVTRAEFASFVARSKSDKYRFTTSTTSRKK
nr:S-layer homology domain-containing protein [Lysinibacillus sp. 2017]